MAIELTAAHQSWRWRILISTYIGYGGYYLTRKVFGLCKTPIVKELDWELGSTAHIWTAFLVAYMLGQFISSYVGRRYGPRLLLLGGLGVSIGCNIAFGFTNSFYTFMAFMFFNGLVQAAGWPGSVGAVSEWLREEERGTLMGIWTTNHIVGNIVVKALTALFLAYMGWRWAFWGCTLLTCAVWWLLYVWQRNKPEDVGLTPLVGKATGEQQCVAGSHSEKVSWREYLEVALNPLVLLMGITYFSVKFLRYALDSWLPAFLTVQGLDASQASLYSLGFDLAGFVGCIVAGRLLDTWFKGNWAALSLVMGVGSILGYLAVIYLGTSPLFIALCFCIVGFMLYGPDMMLSATGAVDLAGARNGVVVAGIVNGLGSVGPIFQEQIIGLLVRGDVERGIVRTNWLALGTSVVMTVLLIPLLFHLNRVRRNPDSARQ